MYGLKERTQSILSEKLLFKNRKALSSNKGKWLGHFSSITQLEDRVIIVCDSDAAPEAQAAMRELNATSITVKQKNGVFVVLGQF